MARARLTVPLLVEGLPLYATDAELAPVVMGKERAHEWRVVVRLYEGEKGFPKFNKRTGGRYVRALVAFFDGVEGLGDGPANDDGGDFSQELEAWTSKPRSRRRPA
jgi:hypothetical protein